MFLVFKQKTAYELRISDGSSDVCSSDLRDVQPDVFTTVPRLLEKVYDKIISRGMALSGLKKGLFFWALRLGMHYDPGIRGNAWYSFRLAMANRLVFNKWRDALGGNIWVNIFGGGDLQPRLTRVR